MATLDEFLDEEKENEEIEREARRFVDAIDESIERHGFATLSVFKSTETTRRIFVKIDEGYFRDEEYPFSKASKIIAKILEMLRGKYVITNYNSSKLMVSFEIEKLRGDAL